MVSLRASSGATIGLVLYLGACAAETPKALSSRVDTAQGSAQSDVFGTLPDAAPPDLNGPLSIDVPDASSPSAVAVDSPPRPPRPNGKCVDGRVTAPALPPSLSPNQVGDWGCTPGLRCLPSGVPTPPARVAGTAPFDRGAAAAALGGVNVSGCARPGGPVGSGHVKVTFEPNGYVTIAEVDSPPFGGTGVGGCIVGKFREARIPAFAGGCVTIGKSFTLP